MLSERDGGRGGRDGRLPEDGSFPGLVGGVLAIGLEGLILTADCDTDRCRASTPLAPLKEGVAPGGVIGLETSAPGGGIAD